MSAYRDAKVALRFELTDDDCDSGQRARIDLIRRRAHLSAALATLMASGFYVWNWGAAGWVGGLALCVVAVVFQRWVVRRSLAPALAVHDGMRRVEVEAGDERFAQSTELTRVSLAWAQLVGWQEDPAAFRVYIEPSNGVVIPKRAFTGAEAEQAFRHLLSTHLGAPLTTGPEVILPRPVWGTFAAYCAFIVLFFGALLEAVLGVFLR